jgi:hypothetical protein
MQQYKVRSYNFNYIIFARKYTISPTANHEINIFTSEKRKSHLH